MPPKYKHPSIEEAACEFLFAPNLAAPDFDLTLPGKLQLKLEPDYAGPSRNQYRRLLQSPLAGPPGLAVSDELFRVQLVSADQRAIIGIGRDALTVSALRAYKGWQLFKPRIERALDAYCAVTSQRTTVRIGLRYINRLFIPADGGAINRFINGVWTRLEANSLDDGSPIAGDLAAINSRHEFATADGFKIIVTLATLQPQAPGTKELLLDIDAVWDKSPVDGKDQIIAYVDKLHVCTGAVFESLITSDTRQLLDAN